MKNKSKEKQQINFPKPAADVVGNKVEVCFDKSDDREPKKSNRYTIPYVEERELYTNISDSGVLLFLKYLDRVGGKRRGNALSVDDETMAHCLGWTIRKVAKHRNELAKAHWFLVRHSITTDSLKTKNQTIYLGKGAVSRNVEDSIAQKRITTIVTDYEVEVIDSPELPQPTEKPVDPTDKNLFN